MSPSRRVFLGRCAAFGWSVANGLPRTLATDQPPATRPADKPYRLIGDLRRLPDGPLWQIDVESPYQRRQNAIRILLPRGHDSTRPTRVLYMLPVELGLATRWGDPLAEAVKTGLHDKHGLICVYPTFDTMPWYGRHAKDVSIRHEAYMTQVVVPVIESHYRASGKADGRILVGFSKSGFGAMSLILRNPSVYGVAGSWDAPLMMEDRDLGLFGTADHFGTEAVFAEHRPLRLIETADADFKQRARLVIAGEDSFGPNPPARFKDRPHTATYHAELNRLGIKHIYNNDLRVKHHWNTGWVEPVVDALIKL